MKHLIFLLLVSSLAGAQTPLFLSTEKTTSLIFPFPVRHVDRGTKDIIVQPVKENEQILLVKAAQKQFAETNLSVVTADGNVYEFSARYQAQPGELVMELPARQRSPITVYAKSILDNPPKRIMKVHKGKVTAMLNGIYIKDDVIFYQLGICNQSPLDYAIDLLQFSIRDKRKGRRTSVQENILAPRYIAGHHKQVKAYSGEVIVVALDKFSIPDAKFLEVKLMEKNGGRHFNLKIYNGQILKARILPELQ